MSTLCKIFALCLVALMTAGCNGHDPCSRSEEIASSLKGMNVDTQKNITNVVCNKSEPKEIRQLFVASMYYGVGDSPRAIQWASYAVDTKASYITYMYLYYFQTNGGNSMPPPDGDIEDRAASYGVKHAIYKKIQKSDVANLEKEKASPYISWMLLGTLDYSNIDTEQSSSGLYQTLTRVMSDSGYNFKNNEDRLTAMFPEMLRISAKLPVLRSVMPSAGENAKSMINYKINTDDFKRYYQ